MVLGFRFRRRRDEEPREEAVDMRALAPPDAAAAPMSPARSDEVPGDVSGSGGSSATVSGADTFNTLRRFEKAHRLDPNLPVKNMRDIDAVLASGNAEKGVEIEQALVEDNSPYMEVRSAVRNYDIDVPANTIRAWTIGLMLCTVGSAINALFSLRASGVIINTLLVQLVAYPVGLMWDLIFPDYEFRLWGLRLNLRPGRFNHKEHVVIVVMSNAAYGGGTLYTTDIVVAQQKFFGQQGFGQLWQILFGITTLCTGFGLAGLARRFLVWPAAMIWPSDLVNAALFYTLHDHGPSDPTETRGWSIGRTRWFLAVFGAAFCWYWVPGWVFQGLTWFCWIAWIWPDSVIVNKLFGGYSGYGLMPVTLDWTVVTGYLQSPLVPPFHAIANTLAGVVVFFVVVSMGLHFSGHWFADFLPVQNSEPYDNTARFYEFSFVLDENLRFDEAEYRSYSPIYFTIQAAMGFGVAFAAITAIIVHVALYHGPQLWAQLRKGRAQEDDVHMRLMNKYRDAPDWWYAVLLAVMVALSFVVVCAWPTGLPWWALVVCLALPLVWTVPIGVVQAMTNIQLGLNVLSEFVAGYLLQGRGGDGPLALLVFKNYGRLCMSQALFFAQDMKLGHYMKVPPRVIFAAQLVAAVWSAVVQMLVVDAALAGIPDVCRPHQPDKFSCDNAQIAFNDSVMWGAIGPTRIFGPDSPYAALHWFWLVGAVAPVVTWLLARRWPRSLWRYISMPVFFGGAGWIPPATVYMYLCWAGVGTVFNFYIRRRFRGWWSQYNYVTSAALDCGVLVGTIVIFFTLYVTKAPALVWFGNAEALGTLDMKSKAVKESLPNGNIFGPSVWT